MQQEQQKREKKAQQTNELYKPRADCRNRTRPNGRNFARLKQNGSVGRQREKAKRAEIRSTTLTVRQSQ